MTPQRQWIYIVIVWGYVRVKCKVMRTGDYMQDVKDVKIPLFVHVYIKCKFTGKRNRMIRKIIQQNKRARRLWPLDFVNRKPKGFYCVCKGRLRFSKRNA